MPDVCQQSERAFDAVEPRLSAMRSWASGESPELLAGKATALEHCTRAVGTQISMATVSSRPQGASSSREDVVSILAPYDLRICVVLWVVCDACGGC